MVTRRQDAEVPSGLVLVAVSALLQSALSCTGAGEVSDDDAGDAPRCLELTGAEAAPQAVSVPSCEPAEAPADLATLDLVGVLEGFEFSFGGDFHLELRCEVAAIDQAAVGPAEVTLQCVRTEEDEPGAAIEVPLRLGDAALRASLCEGESLDLWVQGSDSLHCGRSYAYGLSRTGGEVLVAGAVGHYNPLRDRAAPLRVSLVEAGCEVAAGECVDVERAAIAVAIDDGPPSLIYEGTRRRMDSPQGFVIQAGWAEIRHVSEPCHDCSSINVVIVRSEVAVD